MYRAILPAKFNFVHNPELMDILSQFFSDPLQVGRQHNLKLKKKKKKKHIRKQYNKTSLLIFTVIRLDRTFSYTIEMW